MAILDKVIAAVTPPESDEARAQARQQAEAAAVQGTWFALVLNHHDRLRATFREVREASDKTTRSAALKQLAALFLAHAQAEESVLYPGLALSNEKAHAEMGYNEQAMVKIQMAALEDLPPMSEDFLDKLEHIEGAVLHHMYEEEGTWFIELKDKGEHQVTLTRRFKEEFDRYFSNG